VSMDGAGLPARIAREITAVAVAGLVAGTCFLIVIQEAHRRGHTDLDFNHTMGTIVQGQEAEDQTTRAALGVDGDSAAPTGLISTWLASMALVAVFALAVLPFVRRGWIVRGLALAGVTLLAVGLVYPPLASDYLEEPLGAFGTGYGTGTLIAMILASLVFGIVGSRCHSLVVSAGWWTPRGEVLDEALEEIELGPPKEGSLELTE
jgi:hypothetical protein